MTIAAAQATVESAVRIFPPAGPDTGPRMGELAVSVSPLSSLERLEALWRDLEGRADGSFFTSWSWIGAWLATRAAQVRKLITGQAGGQVVGLAILTPARRRHGPWPRRVLALHAQSGPD